MHVQQGINVQQNNVQQGANTHLTNMTQQVNTTMQGTNTTLTSTTQANTTITNTLLINALPASTIQTSTPLTNTTTIPPNNTTQGTVSRQVVVAPPDMNQILEIACKYDNPFMVQYSLVRGAGVSDVAFCSACKNGNVHIFKLLIKQVEIKMAWYGSSKCFIYEGNHFALHSGFSTACEYQNTHLLDLFPFSTQYNWVRQFYKACRLSKIKLIKYMLDKNRHLICNGLSPIIPKKRLLLAYKYTDSGFHCEQVNQLITLALLDFEKE
jgi:hypothetical protein